MKQQKSIIDLCLLQAGWTTLMYASSYGCTEIVKYLVEETTAQVNVTNNVSCSTNCTPPIMTSYRIHALPVTLLLVEITWRWLSYY